MPVFVADEREKVIRDLEVFFEENMERFSVEIAWLYGSWAKGFPRDDSDVDLALFFCEEMARPEESLERSTAISVVLERILKREVNIIEIKESFEKPMLYYNAIVHGIPVYIRRFQSYLCLRNQALFQMEDFRIFGIGWQYEVAKRNLEALRNV